MKKSLTYTNALQSAMDSLCVTEEEIRNHEYELQDGLYYICLLTDFLRYECVVNSHSMEVLGIYSEPAVPLKY